MQWYVFPDLFVWRLFGQHVSWALFEATSSNKKTFMNGSRFRPVLAAEVSIVMSDDAEDAAFWTDVDAAADEAEAADESDTAHEADTADEAEAEAFWCDVAAAPPSPQRLSDWPIIFLAEARRFGARGK